MAKYRMENTVVDTDNSTNNWPEERDWDGHNHIGRNSGSQWSFDTLFRSRKGRYYIVHKFATDGDRPYAEWVSPEEAVRFMIVNDHDLLQELTAEADRVAE